MKTIRFIGIALMAIILTTGFAACSSDDDNGNGIGQDTPQDTPQDTTQDQPQINKTKLWWAYNSQTGKYGYINEKGEWAIQAQYDKVRDFTDDVAIVCIAEKYYVIDTTGKTLNSTGFDEISNFDYGYATVLIKGERFVDDRMGLIDKSGNYVIEPIYYELGSVDENGLLPYELPNTYKSGFINTKNEIVIEAKYRNVKPFNNGVACVQTDDLEWGAINTENKWTIQPKYYLLFPLYGTDCISFYENGLVGIMDNNGNIKVKPIYKGIYEVAKGNGNIVVRAQNSNYKSGFIDLNGNIVIPLNYDEAGVLNGTYIYVETERNNGTYAFNIMDTSGNVILSLAEDEIPVNAYNGLFLTRKTEGEKNIYTYRDASNNTIFTWNE